MCRSMAAMVGTLEVWLTQSARIGVGHNFDCSEIAVVPIT
jgi:hypothetical protein